jgi:5-methylcytosine-specific restriction protein A
MIDEFEVGQLYSNQEVYASLGVGNAGGVRAKVGPGGTVERLVVLTSVPTAHYRNENPYHDRLENDILIYTGAGKTGEQSISGPNARITQQLDHDFPIYGFLLLGSRRDPKFGQKRWKFLGLLEYLRYYPERQMDSKGSMRRAWVFELRTCPNPIRVMVKNDGLVMKEILADRRKEITIEDREVMNSTPEPETENNNQLVESIRRKLLAYTPEQFEHVIKDLLIETGFERVEVTKYSQDGGIDVNARPGRVSWPLCHLLVQVQAKRWLHTVGRKEVAELRGSLAPHAVGCIMTTSHFSRAAITESTDLGKIPINLIDGYQLGDLVNFLKLTLR